jgi:hypothetical protein
MNEQMRSSNKERDVVTAMQRNWRWRLMLVVACAGLCGGAVAWFSSSTSLEARLATVAAKRSLSKAVFGTSGGSPKVAAMVVDPAIAPEVRLKMRLALIKYGDPASKVLETFGDDPRLHATLEHLGEPVVPVVAFFMENDLLGPKMLDAAARLIASATQVYRRALGRGDVPEAERVQLTPFNTPFNRGLLAIERAQNEGHGFLAQFDIAPDGTARWNKTARVETSLGQFLLGGLRELETKHNTGETVDMADIAWAGADIAVLSGVAKALRLASKTRMAAKEVQAAGAVARSPALARGAKALEQSAAGALKFSIKAGAVYLLARHPGLLTGLFADLARSLGIPAWLGVALGWWVTAIVLIAVALPLLLGLKVLVPVLLSISRAAGWVLRGPANGDISQPGASPAGR